MASSESPRTVKVRGRRRASASSRVTTEANRARAWGSNGWRSPSRVRHAGSDSPSSRVRLFFSTTRPEFSRPSSKEIQRSNGPGTSTPAHRRTSIKACPAAKPFSIDSHIAGRRGNRLAGSVTCPRCGAANAPGTMFCVNCGSALSAGTGAGGPPAAPMYPGAMPGLPSPWDAERQKQIGRTKTGVLLLLIGTLIGWGPYIAIICFLLVFVGAILVILGRRAFGTAHARNVVVSIFLVILGIIITVVAGLILFPATVSSFIPGNAPTPAALTSAFNNFLIILAAGTLV